MGFSHPSAWLDPYGVWDLDFSRYTVALSEVDDPVHSWPAIPRASMEENIGDLGDLTLAAQDSNDNLAEEVFARPENRDETPSVSGLEPIFDAVPSAEDDSKSTLPLLSFRNARREIKTWDSSSEDESEDESDEEPLAKVEGDSSPSSSRGQQDLDAHLDFFKPYEIAESAK